MSRWFRSAVKAHPPMDAAEEDEHLRSVEHALLKLLNDDIEAADKILKEQNSSYHHLGRGISSFIASMLGVEKELLKDAAATLQLAENKTWDDMKKAQKEHTAYKSAIYPAGTEYLLCYSIAQLTSAVTAVLSGSVTEAIKGFYKLRKAYLTLDGILEIETTYLKRTSGYQAGSVTKDLTAHLKDKENELSPSVTGDGSLTDVSNVVMTEKGPAYEPINTGSGDTRDSASLKRLATTQSLAQTATRVKSNLLEQDPASLGITSHTDIFIHSGTRLCYGILLVIFSMIENPLFNKILYIVGFKGDRARGTRYLWESSRFDNFNSAIAGMVLLGYYNGLVGFCDILPTDAGSEDDLSGYPKAKCEALLVDMVKRYPDSKLWKLEEARMNGYNKNLMAAVQILSENSDSNMKQVATINMFELSLTTMMIHDYQLCADSWIQCAELSSWSPTLYAYMAGASYLELYRNFRKSDPITAKSYRDKATEYIRKGPPLAGRQKVMSRELPFDIFIVRKVKKWEERAKSWNVDLVDAIGVSPLSEMMYLWNGIKKQSPEELQKDLGIIAWERTSQPEKHKADLDEIGIHSIITACVLRNQGKYDDAREILKTELLNHDKHEFKGPLKDDWTLPSAHYEMAALDWNEKDFEGVDHKAKVLECAQWLEKVQKWGEAYTLDTRMSFKITTSQVTMKRHRKIMGF